MNARLMIDIDCLVDGELGEAERRALLLALDAEPGGWRRCALAFLEAQAWGEALGPAARGTALAAIPARGVKGGARRRWVGALAASVFLAFALGWAARGGGEPARVASAPLGRSHPAAVERSVVEPPTPTPVIAEVPPAEGAGPSEDSALKAWERQGYQVDRRRRVVAVETDDGRRLSLPVEEVRLRYVGDWTF